MNAAEIVKHFFVTAGSSWVLWFLGALSVASLTVMLERAWFFRTRDADLVALSRLLDQELAAGRFEQAVTLLGRSTSVAASIAATGLRLAHLGPAAVDKAMQSATALERTRLEARLAYLGTLGNNAPFVGLFGTVVGVIQAFEALGRGAGHAGIVANAATQVASQAVMTAIAEALVATAVGILVALPAVAAYNYFQRRIASLLGGSEALSNLVLAYLEQRTGALLMASHQTHDGMITGINVTPLVDITLVLLIIFIVTAKIALTPAVPMDLPHATQSEAVQTVFSVTSRRTDRRASTEARLKTTRPSRSSRVTRRPPIATRAP